MTPSFGASNLTRSLFPIVCAPHSFIQKNKGSNCPKGEEVSHDVGTTQMGNKKGIKKKRGGS